MLKNYPLFFLSICALLGALFLTPLFFISENDYQDYESLAKTSTLSEVLSKTPAAYSSSQKRFGLRKEMWVMKNGLRHCICLEAPLSQLSITHSPESKQISERLFNLRLTYQENLFSDPKIAQQVCVLEGQEALLSNNHVLTAKQLLFSRYQLDTHHLPNSFELISPSFKGKAQSLEINGIGKEMSVRMEGLKASFPSLEHS